MVPSILTSILRALFAESQTPRTVRLGLDVFEDRLVPALASFSGGVLVITTEAANDNDFVSIIADGATLDGSTGVKATYLQAGSLVTNTFSGAVTNIALDLRGGNDTVNVASLTTTAVLVGEWDGNNSVTLGNTRFGGLIAGSGLNTVSIGGGTQNVWSTTALPGFTGGTGLFLGWRYAFFNGGRDIGTAGGALGNVNANVISMNTGALHRSVVNIAGSGNNTFTGGAGRDGVYISGNGSNALAMGAENDLVIIDGNGSNAVSTGAGNDSVTITGSGNNTVYTNGSPDTISFVGGGTNRIDPPPPAVSVNSVQQNEGNGANTLTFTVTLSGPNAFPVTVNYTTQDGTALAGSDYTATSGQLTFAPGQTSKTVVVNISGDTTVEANETFALVLSGASSASGATIGTGTGTATLTNDDATAASVDSVQQVEGNGTGTVTFTVSLSAPSAFPVTVNYTTQDGTAVAGSDYTAKSGTLTFNPGELSQTVTVTILGDLTVEADEAFTLALSGASGATIGTGTGTATLTNDDATATSVNSVQQVEGNGTGTVTFTVTLSAPSAFPVTVNYTTQDGTAVAGSDYTAKSGTLTFNPGETSQTVTVTVTGDTTVESDESFALALSGASGATIGTGTGTATLTNDDATAVSVSSVQQDEGNGTTTLTFTVSLSAPSAFPVTVNYTTQDGTALAGSDYTATSDTLTFNPGETSQTIIVTILGDTTVESDETFTLALSGASGATIGTDTGTATLTNDDATAVSVSSVQQNEGNGTGTVTFTVTLSAPSAFPVTVDFATVNGTATAGSDYTAKSGTLTFNPGELSQTVTVTILGDLTVEADEAFTLALSGASGATIGTGTGTATLTNDDATATSVSSVQQVEGNGTTTLTFTVSLSAPSAFPVTVNYTTQDGTAVAGSDYTAKSGTLTFNPGETSQTITVTILGDSTVESNETFALALSGASGATIGTGTGIATLTNDDATVVSVNSVQQNEGNGTGTVTFTVTLSAPSAFPVTVNYATQNGTATAGSDYTAKSGTLTFNPGETSKTVTVTILGDTTVESDETFTLALSGASGATVGTGIGTATLVNDDVPPPPPPPPPPSSRPTVSVDSVRQVEGNGRTTITFTVRLSRTSSSPVTVNYATRNGTAIAGSDYTAKNGTLTFNPGQTSKTVTVTILGDTTVESDETFALVLSGASGATVGTGIGTATLVNDDVPPCHHHNGHHNNGHHDDHDHRHHGRHHSHGHHRGR